MLSFVYCPQPAWGRSAGSGGHAEDAGEHRQIANPFGRPLPEANDPGT
jgi:hypothetical protein